MRRRTLWWCLYGLVWAIPAFCGGMATAQTEYPFGPHEATYEVTIDSQLTLDLGPIGELVIPSPLPGPLGFIGGQVTVGPIPVDLTSAHLSVNSLAQDVMDYGQAFLGIDETLRRAVLNLVCDGLIRAGIIWAVAMTATVGVLVLIGRARRTQLRMWSGQHRRIVAVSVAAVMAFGAGAGAGVVAAAQPGGQAAPEPLLEGTPLAGAHLTGRLGQLVGVYGRVAVDAYQADVAFYEAASASVEKAFADQRLAAAERAAERDRATKTSRFGLPQAPDASADSVGVLAPTSPSSGGETGSPSPSPSPTPTPPWLRGAEPYGGLKPVLFFSDLHCNIGMAQVMGAAARGSAAEIVLDGGDTTMDGTSVERYCIDQVAAAIPAGVEWVTSPGNHDTVTTAKQEKAAGARVLEGEVERIAGLRILGDVDPTHTEVAQGTSLEGDESIEQVDKRLARTACEDGPVDLLLVHQPAMAQASLESGCVPAAI
ncbi:MAG: metallophosphatase family protein, partial [Bifidobacteriaceae bacterium]|nr:metallophosphatase family protein [Bifidobacteriaceae bacterium]